jgi:hypothetical protein
MEITSLIASVVSAILAIVAIWQAMHFYTQGKNTELHVQTALEGIKAQTDALQALNARSLDRLTKYVTTPREETSQTTQLLFATIRELPDIVLKLLPPSQTTTDGPQRREIINAYIALWNYAGTANLWASFMLPRPEQFDEGQQNHRLVKYIIDRSAADFRLMTGIIDQVRQEEIRLSVCAHLYDEAQTHLRPIVGDTAHHFTRLAKQQQQPPA